MKSIAQNYPLVLGALRALLRAVFDVAQPRYDAAQIEAAVAASGQPSGA